MWSGKEDFLFLRSQQSKAESPSRYLATFAFKDRGSQALNLGTPGTEKMSATNITEWHLPQGQRGESQVPFLNKLISGEAKLQQGSLMHI